MKSQTATIIAIVAVAAGLAGYAAATQGPSVLQAFAATSSTQSSTSSTSSSGNNSICPQGGYVNMMRGPEVSRGGNPYGASLGSMQLQNQVNITSGQTITITSTQGTYRVVGNPSQNGTAAVVLTFTVNSQLSRGFVLSISSGMININGSTYTISSGSAQMGAYATAISGQGTTSSSGQFILRAQAHGDFTGTTSANVLLDFKAGSTEYAIVLSGTIQG